jgi:hypothetical protein
MSRFASTVPFYNLYREPYPREFFTEVARRLAFQGTERLLDAACGPAPLAIGFRPFVASCVGVDSEPEMVASARRAASRANLPLELLTSRFEDVPRSLGLFHIVTVGRALHWLVRDAALPVLERLLMARGLVLVCGAIAEEGANPWAAPFHATRRTWSSDPDERRYHIDPEAWFRDSNFRRIEEISVSYRHRITVESLIGRALSLSTTSPRALGDRRQSFEAALSAAVQPFAEDGSLPEEVVARAVVFCRHGTVQPGIPAL